MEQYKALIKEVLDNGVEKLDRTGVGTISVFGSQSRYNMADGFPLLTLKKTHFKSIVHELLWFLNGDTNIKYLVDNNIKIWNEWAYQRYTKVQNEIAFSNNSLPVILTQDQFIDKIKSENVESEFVKQFGNLGPIYGKQWVNWKLGQWNSSHETSTNQIQTAIDTLKNNPNDRGIIVNAWNVADLKEMALRPCHTMFQFNTKPLTLEERNSYYTSNYNGLDKTSHEELDKLGDIPRYKLSLQLYQRSCDLALGAPFNIASYSLLLHMVAQQVGMIPHEFIHTIGDLHIYTNAVDACKEMLSRKEYDLPTLKTFKAKDIFSYTPHDFTIMDYQSHPAIKIAVAV